MSAPLRGMLVTTVSRCGPPSVASQVAVIQPPGRLPSRGYQSHQIRARCRPDSSCRSNASTSGCHPGASDRSERDRVQLGERVEHDAAGDLYAARDTACADASDRDSRSFVA